MLVSAITLVELEGGIAEPDLDLRRDRLEVILEPMSLLTFGPAQAAAYGVIVRTLGYSRRRVLDRMIAAQALTVGALLLKKKGIDFRDIPGLRLIEW